MTTKLEAKKALAARGFTVHYDTGASGDGGHGSREYYKRPGAELNEYQQPFEHATISRVGREWKPAFFAGDLTLDGAPKTPNFFRVLIQEQDGTIAVAVQHLNRPQALKVCKNEYRDHEAAHGNFEDDAEFEAVWAEMECGNVNELGQRLIVETGAPAIPA